jgi:hypothetical protein
MTFNQKQAEKIGLNRSECATLQKLNTPEAIQDFLTAMPSNPEPDGDTCFSVRSVLRNRCCHCIEAAFVAACALMLHGEPPLLMDLMADGDDDHVVALFKHDKHWGAISKSNHIWLRWRDPVYRTPRELAMSYFHEYVTKNRKTLRSYSRPIDLSSFEPALWVTKEKDCWEVEQSLINYKHYPLVTKAQGRKLKDRDAFETFAGTLKEFRDA